VIERVVGPGNRVVASGAVRCRKSGAGRRVRRIIGLLPCRQMATGVAAICGLNRQIVISAYVTLRAGCDLASRSHLMRIRQRETCGSVIELSVGPGGNRMAGRAGAGRRREIRGHVVRYVAT